MTVPEVKKNEQQEHAANWVPINEVPVYTPRKTTIVCAGAGYGGLMLAYKIQEELKCEDLIELIILEKNDHVGGTWYENHYAGAACDVPAHIYTFMFEPNPDWSSFYVGSREILEYITRTTKKYNLDKNVQFSRKITKVAWDNDTGKWHVSATDLTNSSTVGYEADVFVDASGVLNKWEFPKIKGINDFKGHLVHSVSWDDDHSYAGERVAVIGNGSSAIQIMPVIAKEASYVANLIRNPTWVSTGYAAHLSRTGRNFKYTEEEKRRFREDPAHFLEYRHRMEHEFNKFFYALFNDSPEQQAVHEQFTEIMRQRLNYDEELCARLIPDWKVGCRRLTPGDNYLECFASGQAELVTQPIDHIGEHSIVLTDGREIEVDAIIAATGFDVSYLPKWQTSGRKGASLEKLWADVPTAYFSVCAPEMPNYFIVNGPNCPIGHGSLLSVMKWTIDYAVAWTQKLAREDIKSFVPSAGAVADYNEYTQEFLKRTVWTSGCVSWYKKQGRVTAMYGGSILHYKQILDNIRGEDFEIEYRSPNRFRFMGNGLTNAEVEGGDLATYINK
ncbi:hypothetical protein BZA70DRAFT_266842 [Myxozyma melibiosi]|uniref:Uncharacterized protein n=1 Tax=Myxozyma melibiosi TaxID=54550 RepID=A0ABR1F7A0_9ASCO